MILLLVHLLLVIAVLHSMPLFRQSGIGTVLWALVLFLKVAAGYALIVYYDTHYGGSDMRGYLDGADTVYRICVEDPVEGTRLLTGSEIRPATVTRMNEQVPMWFGRPYSGWFNDSRTVIRIQTLLRFVSDGNIWIHLLWTNLAALSGGIALIRFFGQSGRIPVWALGLLFIPNGLLWSSTILKEPFLLMAMGFTLLAFRKWLESGYKHQTLLLSFSLLLFLLIKPFWLLALLPGLLGWAAFSNSKRAAGAVAGSYMLVLFLAMLAGLLLPDYHLPSLLFGEQLNMWRFSVFGGAGSLIDPIGFAPTWFSLFKHVPETFLVTMIQPWPASWNDWDGIFLFSENILFVSLFLAALFHRKGLFRIWCSPPLMLACCAGIIIVLVSGFTTPVAGTLIRYRWPGVLLLMFVFCYAWLPAGSAATKVYAGESPD